MNKNILFYVIAITTLLSTALFAPSCGKDDKKAPQDDGKKDANGEEDDDDCKDPFGCEDDDDDVIKDPCGGPCTPPKVCDEKQKACVCPADMYEDINGDCVTCGENEEWNERRMKCVEHRCGGDFECCPHWTCDAGGQCVTRLAQCSDDEACNEAIKGQSCINGYCNFKSCSKDEDCEGGTNCFNNYCVAKAPCKGKCKTGEVCMTPLDKCFPIPSIPAEGDEAAKWYKYDSASQIEGCDQTCDNGYLLVYEDPSVTYTAECAHAKCACRPIPPVPFGDTSLYSSIGIKEGKVVASAYNQTYGDLMFVTFGEDGVAKTNEAIILDGVPPNGDIVGDPTRFRKGIAEPGDDVGLYTSIVVDKNGIAHISYYDKTNGNLKVARGEGNDWTIEVVDDAPNAGLYSDITLAPDGTLLLAYFVRDDGEGNSGLRVLSRPASSTTQWTKVYEELAPLQAKPCGGTCEDVCVLIDDIDTCVEEAEGCGGCKDKEEACYDDGSGPKCVKLSQELALKAIPEGPGIMPDIEAGATRTVLCYYDNTLINKKEQEFAGNLVLLIAEGDTITKTVIDGNDKPDGTGKDTGEVGLFCSVSMSEDESLIGVAYQDITRRNLKFWRGYDGSSGEEPIIIDTGVPQPGEDYFVGADNNLIFSSNGNPYIAYNDSSRHRLLWARSSDNGKSFMEPEVLLPSQSMPGAWGYFTDVVKSGNEAIISNVGIFYDPAAPKGQVWPKNKLIYIKKPIN